MKEIGKVWVAEWGYEGETILGIYINRESAIEGIKSEYQQPPYIVRWEETKEGLTGHFKEVPHYSVEYSETFYIMEWSLLSK